MRYIDSSNGFFSAETLEDLALELYKTSWAKTYSDSAEQWYANAANRIHEQYGYTIDYSSPTAFVSDLIKHNLILEKQ